MKFAISTNKYIILLSIFLIFSELFSEDYEFPIKPGTDLWRLLPYEEKIDLLQIPQKQINKLSTSGLIRSYVEFPLNSLIFAYSNKENAISRIYYEFNGLRELINRPDVGKELILYLKRMEPTNFRDTLKLAKFKTFYVFLEVLCLNDLLLSKLSNSEIEELSKILIGYFNQKSTKFYTVFGSYGLYINSLSINKLNKICNNRGINFPHQLIDSQFYILSNEETNTNTSLRFEPPHWVYDDFPVFTPNGKEVMAHKLNLDESDPIDDWIYEWQVQTVNLIQGFVLDATPVPFSGTTEYNCHGYAWHYSLPQYNDKVWIGILFEPLDIEKSFWTDGVHSIDGLPSYVPCLESEATHVVYDPDKINNGQYNDHSMRKISNTGSYDYEAKWAELNFVKHKKGHDPYSDKGNIIPFSEYLYFKSKTPYHIPIKLLSDVTLSGTYTCSGTTIPAGVTLTILPGTVINFTNNTGFIVNGTLNAKVTSYPYSPITFTRSGSSGSWSGIYVSPTGNADFKRCNISYASSGIESDNGGIVNIDRTNITNCFYALRASGLTSLDLSGTEITNYTYNGSFFDVGSSLWAEYSLISYDIQEEPDVAQIGIKNYGGDIEFQIGEISHNGQGLYLVNNGWANLGEEYEENGFNNIVCNVVDINTSEDILAQENYWGGDEPDNFSGNGDVEYDPWLEEPDDDNPYDGECSGYNKSSDSDISKVEASVSKFSSDDYKLYKQGYSKYKKEDFAAAISDFENLISKYPETFFARFALQKWLLLKFQLDSKSEILPYLSSLKESKSVTLTDFVNQMEVLAYRKMNQPGTALSLTTTSKNKSKSDMYNSFFKYQEGLIYKNDLNDSKKAETSFNEYLQEYPDDGRNSIVSHQLETLLASSQTLSKSTSEASLSNSEDNIPDQFELYAAYPNPFNPSTTFRYASPWDGIVKVEIYNALGQRVRLFEKSHFSKGTNELVWNGKNDFGSMVTSGIYFVRFIAESKRDKTQRFEGLSKVIFLK